MSQALPPDVVRACVVSGGVTTHYASAGRGDPVVVLSDAHERVDLLLTDIARDLRVIAPDLAADSPGGRAAGLDFTGWLSAFLEALGLGRVALITDATFASRVARFAELDPERISRVGLLSADPED